MSYISEQAQTNDPFFLFIGWTRPHYPNLVTEEYAGKSTIGDWGDSCMELDRNTGVVLDAIRTRAKGDPKQLWQAR